MKYLRQSIIIRLLWAIIALSWSTNALAEAFPGCLIHNPCDCGCNDFNDNWPSTDKVFHGKTYHSETNSKTSSCACPPYNKPDGRTGCLLSKGPPEVFNVAYMNICAEESPESNYFTPKIRYRNQTCNLACWTLKGDLDGTGECTELPGPYGIPTIRICARMAVPADPINNKPADEGYVVDQHLDFEGYWVDDHPLSNGGYDANGKPISAPNPALQVPKICMYWDPDLLDTLLSYVVIALAGEVMLPILVALAEAQTGIGGASPVEALQAMLDPDFMDYNPMHEGNHHSSGVSPVFQIIIDLMQAQASIEVAFANMIDKIPDYLKYSMSWLIQMEWLLKAGAWIISNVSIEVVKFIGTLNRVVVASFGCVNVPLGPFPPPYCPGLPINMSIPSVFPICTTTVLNNGTPMLQHSTTQDPCKVSNVVCAVPIPFGLCMNPAASGERNNVVHNLIRVAFTDNKPLCTGAASTVDGKCVNINGTLNASSLHANNNNTGIIKLCSQIPAKAGETPCVESTYLLNQCSNASRPWYCSNGLRVVYSIGSTGSPTEYYDESLPDCPVANGLCNTTWGVNVGSFADLAVTFPQRDDNANPKWSSSVILQDPHNSPHTFQAAITRTERIIGASAMVPQEPDQICVYEKNIDGSYVAIGCNIRALSPKPKVRDCTLGGLCTSSFFDPRMILRLEVPSWPVSKNIVDFTEGPIGTNSAINLAGYNYNTYATDKTFAKKPFSGSKAILNGASIYGNYMNDVAPYDVRGNVNPAAIYLGGIEYLNDVYQVGAQYLCLTGYKFDDCLSGHTRQNCVLAQLLNPNVVSCYVFKSIVSKYPSIDICNPNNTDLRCNNIIDSYEGKNNSIVQVISCVSNTSGLTSYCYDYGTQNGPLCKESDGGVGRIVPPSGCDNASPPNCTETLSNGTIPNIDYYNYTPGIAPASNTQTFSNVSANATLVKNVIQKTTDIANGPIVFVYNNGTCTNSTQPYTNDMINACTSARTTSAKVTAICTQTKALVTNHASALYSQLSNACSTAQTNISNILTDQYNTQLLSQMQADVASAATEMSNLMSVINNFANIPTLVTNIVKSEQAIYNSTDVITYPTPLSKINAICTQTQSLVSVRLMSPIIYDALNAACTTANKAPSQATLDAMNRVINGDPTNAAVPGFAQYNISNDGGGTLSANDVANQPVAGGYIAPDLDTMLVRNRTDLENGLCVAIEQPACTPITNGGDNDGQASWPLTVYGNQVPGICNNGYNTSNKLAPTRYCRADKITKKAVFTAVTNACMKPRCSLGEPMDKDTQPIQMIWVDGVDRTAELTNLAYRTFNPCDYYHNNVFVISGLAKGSHTITIMFTPSWQDNMMPKINVKMSVDGYLTTQGLRDSYSILSSNTIAVNKELQSGYPAIANSPFANVDITSLENGKTNYIKINFQVASDALGIIKFIRELSINLSMSCPKC